MVELKVHNDGKEKYQSFEAWIDDIDCERGYGSTEEEAMKEYERNLKKVSRRITLALQDMEIGSFETTKVDWSGKEI